MKPLHHLLLAFFAPAADAVRLLRKPHLRAGAIASNQCLEPKLAFKMKTKLTSMITIVLFGPGVLIAQAQVATEAWVQRYDGPGGTNDYVEAVAVDGNGNVFVTGLSYDTNENGDYATIAYSSAGTPLWTNRYNGPGNSFDQATAVAVGTNGNVFVAGASWGSGTGTDYAIIAYNGGGVSLWTNRYHGPGNSMDQATAVAVGASGNVLVTGYSVGSGTDFDYATIAYSSTGVPLWTNRYNGLANYFDRAVDVAINGNGDVFVTGDSASTNVFPNNHDYATVAYSSAGVPLWTNRYNGPGNDYDLAYAIAVSSSGSIIVTGHSEGSGTGNDYATIAYNGAGVPLWTNRYDGPGHGADRALDVAADAVGNAFVTGFAWDNGPSSEDYTTLAYNSAGVPLWTNRYNGPGIYSDQATAVAVDEAGTVFVTGQSPSTNASYPYIYDCATVAYSTAGTPLWTNRYAGAANGDDRPFTKRSLAIAPNGVVVAGNSDSDSGNATVYDYAVVKYAVQFSQQSDTDGDGLNDLAEEQLAALGFNWQSNNTALVNTLFSNAATAGLFTQQQLQGLAINSPLLSKDSGSGLFKLTIGIQKSTNLINFVPFPMTAPQTSINATGQVEFQFASSNGAAFYRLEAR